MKKLVTLLVLVSVFASCKSTSGVNNVDYKINDETGRDFIVLGFYYELFRKEKSKTEERQELKDY